MSTTDLNSESEVSGVGTAEAEIKNLRSDAISINSHLFALFSPGFVHQYQDAKVEIVFGSGGRLWQSAWFSAHDLQPIVRYVEQRCAAGEVNIYVGAALRHGEPPKSGRGNTRDHYLGSAFAWCEYDGAGDHERIVAICKAHGLEPAIIVTTGTIPHPRKHLYFRIKGLGIVTAEEQKAVNTALRDVLGTDDVTDPIRIMRLAGCVNHPTAKKRARGYIPELVTVEVARQPREYSIDELLALRPSTANVRLNGAQRDPFTGYADEQHHRQGKSDTELFALLQQAHSTGEWHNSMRRAIATMVGRGWSDDAIRFTCGRYCKDGRDDLDLVPLIEGARKKWDKPNPDSAQQSHDQPRQIQFINIPDWEGQPVPEAQWAVRHRIPLRQPCLLSGKGGVGKTLLLLHLSVATVLGRDWLGSLPEQGPVLYLGAEDEEDELHRRLAKIAAYYGAPFTDLGDLHVCSFAGQDATLARFDKLGRMEPTPLYQMLCAQAVYYRPTIIGLDTSSDVFAGNENDRTQVSAFVGLLRNLGMAANAAVILNSHPSLTGINTGSGLSGSTGWHNRVRSRMYFRPVTNERGEEADPDLRALDFVKNNYGRSGDSVLVRWKDGIFVPELQQKVDERRVDEVFMTLLARFTEQGRNVSDKPGTSFAPARFAEEPEAKAIKAGSPALKDAMTRLFAAKKIRVHEEGPTSHKRSKLVVVGAGT